MLTKILNIFFSTVIIIIAVTLAVSNRGKVDLSLFPLPYEISMPLFMFAIITFALGITFGWLIAKLSILKYRKISKEANKRAGALENEISALRSEQLIARNAIK